MTTDPVLPKYPAVWICYDHGNRSDTAEHVRITDYDALRATAERLQAALERSRKLCELAINNELRWMRKHEDQGKAEAEAKADAKRYRWLNLNWGAFVKRTDWMFDSTRDLDIAVDHEIAVDAARNGGSHE